MRPTAAALGPLVALCGACSATPGSYAELPSDLREATVVAVLEPGASIPDTATFSWMPGSFVRLDARFDAAESERMIRTILEEALHRRGLYLVPDNRGDVWVGYAVAVEGALDGARLDATYGISHRGGDAVQKERGALVLDVVDRGSKRALWRGSVAILTDPTLPEEVRRERMERGIAQLLDQLKRGY